MGNETKYYIAASDFEMKFREDEYSMAFNGFAVQKHDLLVYEGDKVGFGNDTELRNIAKFYNSDVKKGLDEFCIQISEEDFIVLKEVAHDRFMANEAVNCFLDEYKRGENPAYDKAMDEYAKFNERYNEIAATVISENSDEKSKEKNAKKDTIERD